MNYTIILTRIALKQFEELSQDLKRRIDQQLNELTSEPRPKGVAKLKKYRNLYRIRVGNYRIMYTIDDEIRIVEITEIEHRKNAYR